MEETEDKDEDHAEQEDDDEAAEVEGGPVAGAEHAQAQDTLGPAGPAQPGAGAGACDPLVLGPESRARVRVNIGEMIGEIKLEKFHIIAEKYER